MKYDPRRHHRRSIRLKGYDYRQPGAYFVTICTCQREELFGQIVDGEMQLSPLGELIKREWFRSAQMRREIELFDDELVIMPNHIHGIVHIVEVGVGVDGVHPDETRPDDVDKPGAHHAGARRAPARVRRSLASFVAGFKSAVTSHAGRELGISNIWQRNYDEHIIRDDAEYVQIRTYIQANPLNLVTDQLHPAAAPNRFNP